MNTPNGDGLVGVTIESERGVIEVEVEHPDLGAVAACRRHRSLELVTERGPIR